MFTRLACFAAFGWFLFSPTITHGEEKSRPPVFAHYMPWYTTTQTSPKWGWHWTMDHYDPDIVQWDGKREAASHDYPLIGLYDSSDHAVLECQVLLMKLAGIDGVIIDWYGTEEVNDYAKLHENTLALIPYLKSAGLKFAICYEDQSIGPIAKAKEFSEEEATDHAAAQLQWLAENWFSDESYFKIDGEPVLLLFGPQYFKSEKWGQMVAQSGTKPKVYVLPHLKEGTDAAGVFGWMPVDGGKTVSPEKWKNYLTNLYSVPSSIGVAFPGFHDIYAQAGISESHGRIDSRLGETFTETLDLALEAKPPFIQIATWNDYGEGTQIEPTHSLGYRHLEALQERLKPGFEAKDLRLPVELHRLHDAHFRMKKPLLDEAGTALYNGDTEKARQTLAKLAEEATALQTAPGPPFRYKLTTNIGYREEPEDDYAANRCRLDVYHPANVKPFPTVVWFHGGGISKGNKTIPQPLIGQGIGVVTANYRLSPQVESPTYIEDAAAAVAWTIKNIAKYGGDPKNVYVSGHSAGGYLASMVGLDSTYLKPHGLSPDDIAGLIPFSGHTITHFTVRKEQGIPGHQPIVDKLAPIFHVSKTAPPMLLITGDREKELMGRYEENAYFWRMMQVAGHKNTTLRELEGYDHGGMPEPAFPLLLKFIESNNRE
ncbi:carboxylesterase family protein [Verrucomicrobiales bacterium]|nr:carboxylesterase family protein [Verrucomicrobiales bacterium]